MKYKSVDRLQNALAGDVFHHTKDAKKASGRALGTMVEIITFYLLKSWGFENSVAIERALAEYGNLEITHNVEYSLHPILNRYGLEWSGKLPITANGLLRQLGSKVRGFDHTANKLLTSSMILRNSCVIAREKDTKSSHLTANLLSKTSSGYQISVMEQYSKPYAMFECKRVGVEEGARKGPQTIEKAKQGAYVAKSVSSLQKFRTLEGELYGLIYKAEGQVYTKPSKELLAEIISSDEPQLLRDFILTIGVVSNHGNWFTSDDHNKEIKVLAQSYDWLVFLSDEGLAEFITELLLEPTPVLEPAKRAFLLSYSAEKKKNAFTKVQMDYEADQVLQSYFRDNLGRIENWFNIIAPIGKTMQELHAYVSELRDKNWQVIHSL